MHVGGGIVSVISRGILSPMVKRRVIAVSIIVLGAALGYFVYWSQVHQWRPFKLGLDLSGGTHLVYDADTSKIDSSQVADSLAALQTVIERRVNAFGVGEPVVQTQQS